MLCSRQVLFLVLLGVFVHCTLMYAALYVYFSSPIDNGMNPIKSTNNPPAKRVVFIVVDGLRAEAVFSKAGAIRMPNLTKIRKTRGSWGVAHARVPTQSRPGRAALLAGIHEDPSAILFGWKRNLADFDTVVNESESTWAWGSPEMMNMLSNDNSPHVHTFSYDSVLEERGKKNTTELDFWVFENIMDFIEDNIQRRYSEEVRESGNIFLIHLPGIDNAGHIFKPESREYVQNIRMIDICLPKLEKMFELFFNDCATAYILTSDHGMTDWGTHGGGSPQETDVPIIAWGPAIDTQDYQKDIEQIDIPLLISALIGINYPMNSVGTLPLEYISTSETIRRKMLLTNIHQIFEIYKTKNMKILNKTLYFKPYLGVTVDSMKTKLKQLENDLMSDDFVMESRNLIKFLLKGVEYYHNYYHHSVCIAVTIGFVFWIIYIATFNIIIVKNGHKKTTTTFVHIFFFIPVYFNIATLIYMQELPWIFFLYFMFPVCMLQLLVTRYRHVKEAIRILGHYGYGRGFVALVVYISGLRLIVMGFTEREAFCAVMFLLAGSVYFSSSLKDNSNAQQKITWTVCCILLSLFPLLPIMSSTVNLVAYAIGYGLWWRCIDTIIKNLYEYSFFDLIGVEIVDLQHAMVKITPTYTIGLILHLFETNKYIELMAWIWAFYAILIIMCSTTDIFIRLTSVFLGFIPFYMMATSTTEIVFLFVYVYLLYAWLMIESKCCGYLSIYEPSFIDEFEPDRRQTRDDFRRAFFFIVLFFMGFFGTGNIDSLSSLDPLWMRCLITDSDPIKTAGLIFLRTIVPFVFVVCVFRAINVLREGHNLTVFCTVLTFSEIMLLELFYHISNVGTWHDMEMKLLHFLIMQVFLLVLIVLYVLCYLLTTIEFTCPLNDFFYRLWHDDFDN